MNKLYINITNHCNLACPFCCMYSSPAQTRYITVEQFLEAIHRIEDKEEDYIIQLEGGEPLSHPYFSTLLSIATSRKRVKEVVIDTNGFNLFSKLDIICRILEENRKPVKIKPSINRYLESQKPDLIDYLKRTLSAIEFVPDLSFECNVRAMTEEELEGIKTELGWLGEKSNFHLFNSYGRLKGNESVPALQINQIYSGWTCVASDGTDFGMDLEGRAEHERV